MQIQSFNDDLYEILTNRAVARSKHYYHTFCGTPHLFQGIFSFFSKTENPEYQKIYEKIKGSLNSRGISGKKFEEEFLNMCPRGSEPTIGETFSISPDREFQVIVDNLRRLGLTKKRQATVVDLILELFSDKNTMLYEICANIISDNTKVDEMFDEIVKEAKPPEPKLVQELEEIDALINVHKRVQKHPVNLIGAEDSIRKVLMGLSGRSIKNVLLLGKAGVGKSVLIDYLAQKINEGDVPKDFKNKIIYEIDSTVLVAGCRYRGDMEAKIEAIIDAVKDRDDIILFIDELHTFLSLGAGSDNSDGAGNLIKPYLTRGEIQVIGCTTEEEFTKYIRKDKAFASRFHEVKIAEPTSVETRKILEGIKNDEMAYFKREIRDEILDKTVELSQQYSLDMANPRKAINMLELACAYGKIFREQGKEINLDDMFDSIKLRYNIYISKDKVGETKKGLFDVLLGQDSALNQVVRDLEIVDGEIVDPMRPLLSILLAGPTGTGKTETASLIAQYFYGSRENLIKINCGEYSTEMDVTKLSGASAGFVGYDDEPYLIKSVREKPNSIIVFDEIEKAHQSIQKILLSILDTGEMRDNKGNAVSFRNCIIIFTTNLGCTNDTLGTHGFGLIKSDSKSTKLEIEAAIKDYFKPEFLGRLDDIIYYDMLTKDVLKQLVNRYTEEFKKRSPKEEVKNIKLTDDDIEEIFKNASIETQGARGVKKAVQKKLADIYIKSKK